MEKLHGDRTEKIILDDLCKALDSQGSLPVIRHGFKCFGKKLRVAFFAPASGMNPETERRYKANRLTVTRQLQYRRTIRTRSIRPSASTVFPWPQQNSRTR